MPAICAWCHDVMGEQQNAGIGRCEADGADAYAGPEFSPHHHGIDLRAGEEGEQDGAEAGKEVDPRRERQADQVAGDRADDDFGECHRNRDPQTESTEATSARPIHKADASQTLSIVLHPTLETAALRRPSERSRRLTTRKGSVADPTRIPCAVGVISPWKGRLWGTPSPETIRSS